MALKLLATSVLLVVSATAEQVPLPELRTEPTNGGSVFFVRNIWSQPLTAFFIELVDYPGSSYSLLRDEIGSESIAPGVEKRIPVSSMTVGAVPDYVKMQAALYADGSSSGVPEKVTQLVQRRRIALETTRELIRRVEKAQSAATPKATLVTDLKQWADSMPPLAKADRSSTGAMEQAATRALVAQTLAKLDAQSLEEVLTGLRASERLLVASKPAL
jgi:hypothetical protein